MPPSPNWVQRLPAFWRSIPLARQVFLAMFCSMAATTSLYFIVDIYTTNRRFLFMEKSTMESVFPVLRRIIEDSMVHRTRAHIRDLFSPPVHSNSPERMLLLDSEKKIVDLNDLGAGLAPRRHPTPKLDPQNFMVMDFPMRAKPACFQCHAQGKDLLGYVRIISEHRERMEAISDHFKMHLALLALNMILMGIWATWIVRRMIQSPLKRLVAAMGRVAHGQFDTRIENFPQGELRDIVTGFNAMVQKIEQDRREIVDLNRRQVSHMERLVAVGEVAAHLAHEVRNPLTGIGSAIQIMEQETPRDNPRRDVFAKILAQLSRMDQAMANFLNFARMPEAVVKSVDLREPLDRVAFLIGPRLKSQKIELKCKIPERLPIIRGDPGQMEQVFLNVCLNAIQAMPNGGTLRISAGAETEGSVLLEFADTGHGVPSHKLDQVFKPFFTTRERGSGLGLPIAKQIVMAHNGEIWLESVPGEGTAVYVRLPTSGTGA